jgi:hypothetical protein
MQVGKEQLLSLLAIGWPGAVAVGCQLPCMEVSQAVFVAGWLTASSVDLQLPAMASYAT